MDIQTNDSINDPRGSQWRKWDLHVHSPESSGYTGSWDQFVEQMKSAHCDVIGINDYFSVSGYKKLMQSLDSNELNLNGKIIFPVVEMRMTDTVQNRNTTTNGVIHFNFHVIFDNQLNVEIIENFIRSLECNETTIGIDYNDKEKLCKKKVSFDSTIKKLRDDKVLRDRFLIWLPYDEYGGIDEIDPQSDGWIKEGYINKSHIIGTADATQSNFFHWNSPIKKDGTPKFTQQQFKEWFKVKKPCIKGSDSHIYTYPIGKLKNSKSQPIDKYCWIKADTTFEGLKEILYEPTERVHIGEEPPILKRVNENKEKYIEMLRINSIQGRQPKKGKWFQNVEIKLNKELVAIIGNKGCGKSAISDILGLLGNAHDAGLDQKNFSFLNNVSSKKRFRQTGFSENFKAEIIWADTNSIKKNLNESVDFNQIQKVKYLPQNYFEKITNELELEEFEKNLKNVIFSHVPDTLRLGKNTFDELEKYKSTSTQADLQIKINELEKIVSNLAQLERKHHINNINRIQSALTSRENDLNAHNKIAPEQPKVPDQIESDVIQKATLQINEKIENLKKEMVDVESKISEAQVLIKKLNLEKEELRQIVDDIQRFDLSIKKYKSESKSRFSKFGLDIEHLIKCDFNIESVEAIIREKQTEINKYEPTLKTAEQIEYESRNNKSLESDLKEKSLIIKKKAIHLELKDLVEQLSKPEKEFQEKKAAYDKWLLKKKEIEGDKEDPNLIPGSIEYLKKHLKFLTNEVPKLISTEKENAIKKSCEILAKKNEILNLYSEFKKAVDSLLSQDSEYMSKFPIKVDVGYKLKSNFQKIFLDFINKAKSGTFNRNGEKILSDIVEGIDLSNENNLKGLITTTLNYLDQDQREEVTEKNRSIVDQISKLENFYQFLFSLNYLEPTYELKYDDKKLDELSPGEKGALLIVFYLMIDKGNIPLIIDQPEDNLDNQSVFDVLRHFIVFAKKRRQIIIVTHNPNLAVGADAEQIIYVHLDKKNDYAFSYKTGSIENPEINKELVRILEGTMPAFDKRKLKYYQN